MTQTTIENALKETEKFEHKTLGEVQDYLNVLDDRVFPYIKKDLGKSSLKMLDPEDLADRFRATAYCEKSTPKTWLTDSAGGAEHPATKPQKPSTNMENM